MNRRTFLSTLGGGPVAAPLVARARRASGNEARGSVTEGSVAAANTREATK